MISRRKLIRIAAPAIIGIAAAPKLARAMQIPIDGWGESPFSFPAGIQPSFNPNHIAATSTHLSVVPMVSGVGLVNLLSGVALGKGNTPTSGIASIGPYVYCSASGQEFTFGQPTITPTGVTMAVITMWPVAPAGSECLVMVGGNMLLYLNSGPITLYNSANVSSGITPVAGVPYFIAVSTVNVTGGGPIIFAITNLNTGAIQIVSTSSVTGAQNSANPGAIGNNAQATTSPSKSYIAAAMYSYAFNSAAVLEQWAARPWDFWYQQDAVMAELKGSAAAVTSSHLLPLLGVGQ